MKSPQINLVPPINLANLANAAGISALHNFQRTLDLSLSLAPPYFLQIHESIKSPHQYAQIFSHLCLNNGSSGYNPNLAPVQLMIAYVCAMHIPSISNIGNEPKSSLLSCFNLANSLPSHFTSYHLTPEQSSNILIGSPLYITWPKQYSLIGLSYLYDAAVV